MVAAERFQHSARANGCRRPRGRRAQSGLHHGGRAPVWLQWNADTKRYEVVDRVADIMRLMVDLRLQGLTETEITREMNKVGPTRDGFPVAAGQRQPLPHGALVEKDGGAMATSA